MERYYKVGQLVLYENKNEVGLICEVHQGSLKVWWHTGGTRSVIPKDLVRPISPKDAVLSEFENDYALPSLLERQLRLSSGDGDVTDLIDGHHIRDSVHRYIQEVKKTGGHKDVKFK